MRAEIIMNEELRIRLAEYERRSPIKSDGDMMRALNEIIGEERAKSPSRRNYDLMDEAIDASFLLEGVSPDEIRRGAASVSESALGLFAHDSQKAYATARIKWLIPAAVIIAASLAAVTAAKVFDDPYGDDIDDVKEYLESSGQGGVHVKDDREIMVGEGETVASLEEADAALCRDGLLLPYGLDKDRLTSIDVTDYGERSSVYIRTELGEVEIKTDQNWGNTLPVFVRTGSFDVVYSRYDGVYQGEFVYKNCMYCLTSDSEGSLEELIGSMEEKSE